MKDFIGGRKIITNKKPKILTRLLASKVLPLNRKLLSGELCLGTINER